MSEQIQGPAQDAPPAGVVEIKNGMVSIADYQKLQQEKEAELVHIERIYQICVKTNTELQNENDALHENIKTLTKERDVQIGLRKNAEGRIKYIESKQEGAEAAFDHVLDKMLEKLKEN